MCRRQDSETDLLVFRGRYQDREARLDTWGRYDRRADPREIQTQEPHNHSENGVEAALLLDLKINMLDIFHGYSGDGYDTSDIDLIDRKKSLINNPG